MNCAAIPPSLIASELFGNEKGSFTGATQRRLDRFESADGETIFLDELGDLPAETQVALLRVLQEREFERVGGTQTATVDVRVITATNRDPTSAAAEGKFRQDFFYRLNVFPIRLPALRERIDDISLWVGYPAEYRSSGVMTFIVTAKDVVYEKDLGSNTSALASAMAGFHKDATWRPTHE